MFRGILAWILAVIVAPQAAIAAGPVALKSAVFVETVSTGSDGKPRIELRAAETVTPGDRLVFVLTYRNGGPEAVPNVVITNPVPQAVAYDGAEAGTLVSVDGGRTWGPLARLRVVDDDGALRRATPPDVTHVRWTIGKPVPPGATGRLSFRGTVK